MCLNQRHAGDLWYKITLKILYMQFFIKNVLKIDFNTQIYKSFHLEKLYFTHSKPHPIPANIRALLNQISRELQKYNHQLELFRLHHHQNPYC